MEYFTPKNVLEFIITRSLFFNSRRLTKVLTNAKSRLSQEIQLNHHACV